MELIIEPDLIDNVLAHLNGLMLKGGFLSIGLTLGEEVRSNSKG